MPVFEPNDAWPVTIRNVPNQPRIVVKATQPTAADYGETSIPIDALWVLK